MAICTARRANGQPCRASAIHGGAVCSTHGGSAPQVIAAARQRLLMLIDPALGVLARAVRKRPGKDKLGRDWEPSQQEIAAAREVLNRAGVIATDATAPATDNGTVLWEEFIAIHRRAHVVPAVVPDA